MARYPVLLLIVASACARGDDAPNWSMEFSLFPYQHTIKRDTDFTINVSGDLPGRFSYFSYQNFTGTVTGGSAAFDRSEQNLRYSISDTLPVDLNLQGVFVRGDGNDFSQFGLRWRLDDTRRWQAFFDRINLSYRVTFNVIRWGHEDSDSWAMEHFFYLRLPGISDRLYVSGFVDQAFGVDVPDGAPDHPIVAEVQLGVRLWRDLYSIAEYRINQWQVGDEYNLAAGIEYQVRF